MKEKSNNLKEIRKGPEEAKDHVLSTIDLINQLKKELQEQELSESTKAILNSIEEKLAFMLTRALELNE